MTNELKKEIFSHKQYPIKGLSGGGTSKGSDKVWLQVRD